MTVDAELLRKAQRYLESAKLLRDSGDCDSAVSRAYYAALYLAEVLLDRLGLSYSSHRGVISAFGLEFAKTSRLDPRFHGLLISAFEKRQRADYLADAGDRRTQHDSTIILTVRSCPRPRNSTAS